MVASRNLAALALVLVLGCQAERSTSAELVAREWMSAHGAQDPDAAGMEELKNSNPDAFAIVQALMTKRSLGLLNPKHPTTAMNSAPSEEGFTGAEAHVAPEPVVAAQEIEAPAPPSSHHHGSWLNWKPADSAADDAMVKNVLGSVAGGVATQEAPVQAPVEAPVATARAPSADKDESSVNKLLSTVEQLTGKHVPTNAAPTEVSMESSSSTASELPDPVAPNAGAAMSWGSIGSSLRGAEPAQQPVEVPVPLKLPSIDWGTKSSALTAASALVEPATAPTSTSNALGLAKFSSVSSSSDSHFAVKAPSIDKDESSVNKLLSTVEQMTGKSVHRHAVQSVDAPAAKAGGALASFSWGSDDDSKPAMIQKSQEPQDTMEKWLSQPTLQ